MSNSNSPFGFRNAKRREGSPPNYGLYTASMLATQSTAMFQGDVCLWGTSASAGYIIPGAVTSGGATIAGIVQSFSWLSISQKKRAFGPYWPGNDAVSGTTVDVKLINDAWAILEAQNNSGSSAITQANVGSFINFTLGSGGNTNNGLSGMGLDYATIATSQGNLPFVITALVQPPKSDPTSPYNIVQVSPVNIAVA